MKRHTYLNTLLTEISEENPPLLEALIKKETKEIEGEDGVISSFPCITLKYNGKEIAYFENYKLDTTHWGATASIFKGTYGNEAVAVRRISTEICFRELESPETLHAQVVILKQINSPYLLAPKFDFIEAEPDSDDRAYYYQIMEYFNGITLSSFCSSPESQKISLWDVYTIAYQIAKGVEALHRQKTSLIHCDLSDKNILLDEKFNVKIIDFDYLGYSGKR